MERATSRLTAAARPGGNPFARLLGLLIRLDQAYRDERAIAHLDAHLRRDIGLTDHAEGRWDAPEIMRRR